MSSITDSSPATTTAKQPADAQARRRALNPMGSFAVAAPAGSGKTGLLTKRVLTLLAHCENPEEVLCITFTRKAAGEMQERITRAIAAAANSPEPCDEHERETWQLAKQVLQRDSDKGWQLLLTPNRLRVMTIDGLCRSLTQQLPLDSGLGAQPETLEQPQQAYRLAAQALLKYLEKDSPFQADISRLVQHLDNNLDAIEALLINLLGRREQWLELLLATGQQQARDYLEGVLEEVICEQLEDCAHQLSGCASDIALLADYAGSNLREQQIDSPLALLAGASSLPAASPEQLPQWLGIRELLLTQKGEWRKRLDKKCGFPPGGSQEEKATAKARKQQLQTLLVELQTQGVEPAQLQQLAELPYRRYREPQWQLLDSLTRLLPVLAAQLKLVFQQLGATDFSEISQAALTALGEDQQPSEMALKLDYRIQHILIDEFQDTASPQLRLLEKLIAGWQTGDGRSLFIVGDGMQSCYGFRDANVGIFLDARQHGVGLKHQRLPLQPLDLTVNFRSQQGIIDWVNRAFANAFPSRDDISRGAVSYSPSIAFKPPLAHSAVNCFACIDDEQDHTATGRDSEAAKVVELVQQTQAQRPDDKIAILVRTRPHLKDILAALDRAKLSWQATEIDPLASRMAIIDMMSLTRALLNPADRIAWLAILRAPWCGLDLHDLHVVANEDLGELSPRRDSRSYPVIWQQLQHFQQLQQLSETGRQLLGRLVPILQQGQLQRRRKPLRQWLEGIWLALGGPAAQSSPEEKTNTDSYLALLEKHDSGGQIADWQIFKEAVSRLFAAPRADANPKLQVMTIHKSKGLEFDTVIIPGLDKRPRLDDKQLILWLERINRSGDKHLLLSPLAAAGEEQDPLYQFLRREQGLKDQLEATRLLYVGCTRAIKQLHLLAQVKLAPAKKGKDENSAKQAPVNFKPPASQSLLSSIWPHFSQQAIIVEPSLAASIKPQQDANTALKQPNGSGPASSQHHILRLPAHWQRPSLGQDNLLQAYRGRDYIDPAGGDSGNDSIGKNNDNDDNRPQPLALHSRSARHVGTVLHRSLRRITLDGWQQWTAGRRAQQAPYWKIQLRQLGLPQQQLEAAIAKLDRAIDNIINDPVGQWVLDNRHADSSCELELCYQHFGQTRLAIVDRSFIGSNAPGETSYISKLVSNLPTTRWVIDYKSSEPQAGEALESFLARESADYQPQLARYAQRFRELGPEPIRTALYFPLLQRLQLLDCAGD